MTSNSVNISFTASQLLKELLLWADMQEMGVNFTIPWTFKHLFFWFEKKFSPNKIHIPHIRFVFVFSVGLFLLLKYNYAMHNTYGN